MHKGEPAALPSAGRPRVRPGESPLDTRLRRQRQVERVCRTPRIVFELLEELDRYHDLPDLDEWLEAYASVTHGVLGWLGGDQFAPLPFRVVAGGRQCSPRGS